MENNDYLKRRKELLENTAKKLGRCQKEFIWINGGLRDIETLNLIPGIPLVHTSEEDKMLKKSLSLMKKICGDHKFEFNLW